jgi:hypothetical protein
MVYFITTAILLTFLLQRNPARIHHVITIRWSILIVGCFGTQIALAFIALKSQQKYELILTLTFVGILVGLWINRSIVGIKWILWGAGVNIIALIVFAGAMPVSETAMEIVGQNTTSFATDSRHQVLGANEPFWFLADWIPLQPYVLSLGDILVGVGFIRLLTANSPSIRKKQVIFRE